MYVVIDYRLPVAWGFCETDISWDDGLKDLGAEEAAKIGRHLLRESRPVVVHCKDNSLDRERWIDRAAEAHQRIK